MISKRVPSVLLTLAVATALLCAVLAGEAGAAVHHVDGTVVSKNAKDRSFRVSTHGGTVRIRVDSATVFDRIPGFGGLRRGLEVEVEVKQTGDGLLATKVEPRNHGGGGHDGGAGHDDGGSHDGHHREQAVR